MTKGGNPAIVTPLGLKFKITDTKLYVPVVILSKENDIKLLVQLKSGFKKNIKWNKYRSQMTIQPKNNKLKLFNLSNIYKCQQIIYFVF